MSRPESYNPLREPGYTQAPPGSVTDEMASTRRYVDKIATANIHDHTAMVEAAVGLDHRVRALLAALDAESERGDD